jgi:hypothetical protein
LAASLRHFVFNRQSLERPWRVPFALGFWLAGFPVAAMKRIAGARLLCCLTQRTLRVQRGKAATIETQPLGCRDSE